jgi:hypothetical protein
MSDIVGALDAAPDQQEAGCHHGGAVALEHVRPDNQVGDAGLIFERDEADAAGRPGPLAHQHDTGDLDARA